WKRGAGKATSEKPRLPTIVPWVSCVTDRPMSVARVNIELTSLWPKGSVSAKAASRCRAWVFMVTAVNQVLSASVMVRPGACLWVAPTSISSRHRPRCSMARSLMCRSSLLVLRGYRHSPCPCQPGVCRLSLIMGINRTLRVVTHPQSQHHVDGLVDGWFDSELSALGTQQAGLIAFDAVHGGIGGPALRAHQGSVHPPRQRQVR